jgi:predicted secreted protein
MEGKNEKNGEKADDDCKDKTNLISVLDP